MPIRVYKNTANIKIGIAGGSCNRRSPSHSGQSLNHVFFECRSERDRISFILIFLGMTAFLLFPVLVVTFSVG
jgi:hypothetical protein